MEDIIYKFGFDIDHFLTQNKRSTPNIIKELTNYYNGILTRKIWPELESNQRHKDFQSSALPTELSGQKDKLG
jgi:hypothetical protein